jgi:CheY-like chemotaxis protein
VLARLGADKRTKTIPVIILTSSKEQRDIARLRTWAPTVTSASRSTLSSSSRRFGNWASIGSEREAAQRRGQQFMTALHLLIVDDSADDAELMVLALRRAGVDPTYERVETPEAMEAALARESWDLIISGYAMPRFSALAALKLLQDKELDLPFILVSGSAGENVAVDAMKAGAHHYILKDNLARLAPAVERELRDAEVRRERKRAESRYRICSIPFRSASSSLAARDGRLRHHCRNPAARKRRSAHHHNRDDRACP